MSRIETQIERRRWQSPRKNHGLLSVPGLADAGEVARRNRDLLRSYSLVLDGQHFDGLRNLARREYLLTGRQFLAELSGGRFADSRTCCCQSDFEEKVSDSLWFMAGHQPVLTHAGVWVKNIAAAVLAQANQGLGANLIVDPDVIATRSLSIPVGSVNEPARQTVPFDEPAGAMAGEEARVTNPELFTEVSKQVSGRIQEEWGYEPLIGEVWRAAVVEANETGRLTRALSAVRIGLERRHGLNNIEAELSQVAGSDAFLHFFRHMAMQGDALFELYNRCLSAYRKVNRIHSHSHPVPNLVREGDAVELPFWWWKEGDLHRRRLFVTRQGDRLQLGDGSEVFGTISAVPAEEGNHEPCRELRDLLLGQSLRLRPRALMTTLFSRLFLADLFIHGIGGAKYDEMTDALGQGLFGITMPEYLTLTGTYWLPLGGGFPQATEQLRLAQRALRDVRYNAEKSLDNAEQHPLVIEKQKLIAELKELKSIPDSGRQGRAERRRVARQLRQVEQDLAALVADRILEYRGAVQLAEQQVAANRILRNREFAAILHPMSSYAHWVTQIRDSAGLRG